MSSASTAEKVNKKKKKKRKRKNPTSERGEKVNKEEMMSGKQRMTFVSKYPVGFSRNHPPIVLPWLYSPFRYGCKSEWIKLSRAYYYTIDPRIPLLFTSP